MKRAIPWLGAVLVVGLVSGGWLRRDSGATTSAVSGGAIYRCPMHTWVIAAVSGRCTVCGMTLMPPGLPAAEVCGLPGTVTLNPAVASVVGVRTAPVARQPLVRTLRIMGTIEVDATRRRVLTAWADGRIDRLFVNSVGAEIRAGEPLLALFSRDLFTVQWDLLQLARAGPNAASALAEQRTQMLQLGLTDPQIDALLVAQEASATPVIMAPHGGTIIAQRVEEGQWVRTGDRLFEVADFSRLWLVFELSALDLPWARVGAEVEIEVAGTTVVAPITFIDPNLNPVTRAAVARVEFANPGGVARGTLAEGRMRVEHGEALVVPRTAVLNAGEGPVVWVDLGAQAFAARVVRLGRCGDTLVEVLDGVAAGERVVVHGALLLDAQARLDPPSAAAAARPGSEE